MMDEGKLHDRYGGKPTVVFESDQERQDSAVELKAGGIAKATQSLSEAFETFAWGSAVGQTERDAQQAITRSRHRREAWAKHHRVHRLRLKVLAIPALLGVALLGAEITRDYPIPALVAVGIAAVLPFLIVLFDD